jgi:hypothetical protein
MSENCYRIITIHLSVEEGAPMRPEVVNNFLLINCLGKCLLGRVWHNANCETVLKPVSRQVSMQKASAEGIP